MRNAILITLYEWSKKPYQKWFKRNEPWNLKIVQLLGFPEGSLGYELGDFLNKNNFKLQEKLENHDVFHLITDIGTSVPEEIALQFFLLGNGKLSVYLLLVIITGSILFPDYLKTFIVAYNNGRSCAPFYHLNYRKLLHFPLHQLQCMLKIYTPKNSSITLNKDYKKLLISKV